MANMWKMMRNYDAHEIFCMFITVEKRLRPDFRVSYWKF